MEKLPRLPKEKIELLKKPLPKEAIKQHPTKKFLSTIKAIYVVERLNEVFGLGGWVITNEVVEATDKNIVVKSNFRATDYDLIVSDIFGGNDNPDRGDAYKGACTDALTKIGSYLYIGMDVFKGLADHAETPNGKMQPNEVVNGTDLPWLTEKQFHDAMERMNNGEPELFEKIKQTFRMKKEYRDKLTEAATV